MICRLYFFVFLVLLVSCTNKKEETVESKSLMYEPSEMTILMRRAYEYNKVLKQQIINKDSLIGFPEELLNIHTAILTDSSDRDSSFQILSRKYLSLQKSIYTRKDSIKKQFNKTIVSCVECHQTRCDGPIPKIKRLLIN